MALVLCAAVVACSGLFLVQAWQAASSLSDSRGRAAEVERLIRSGDFAGASGELERLSADTHRAADATDGWLWDLGGHVPGIGTDLTAVQTAASVLDRVTRENAPVALRLSRAVEQGRLRPHNGRVDLAAIADLAPMVEEAAASIARQRARLAAIDLDALGFPFRGVVRELVGQVDRAHGAATATATAFRLLPEMLGAAGPRSYLLLVQNNAEIRSTGGIPGSVAVLHADRGRVRMGFQGSAADVSSLSDPGVRLPEDVLSVYGPTILHDLRDSTFNPDFPQVARVAAALLEQRVGIRVDGVLSIDPVALAFLLQGIGPVQVDQTGPEMVLTHANVTSVLLNLTYQLLPDPAVQDQFFEDAARSIFDAVMAGDGSSRAAITGLARGVEEHRVLVWSRHRQEQARLAGTAVAGELPGKDRHPQVGFYLNDATAGKPEYYLDFQPSVSARTCPADGSQQLEASIALESTMPRDVSTLSTWITGDGTYTPRGTIAFNLRVYGPVDGTISRLTVDGERIAATSDRHARRQVAVVPLVLEPGERVVVRAQMTSGPGQSAGPVLSFTPGVRSQPNGVELTSACDGRPTP